MSVGCPSSGVAPGTRSGWRRELDRVRTLVRTGGSGSARAARGGVRGERVDGLVAGLGGVTYAGDPDADRRRGSRASSAAATPTTSSLDRRRDGLRRRMQPGPTTSRSCTAASGSTLRRYAIRTGGGADTVRITGDTAGGSADLGTGNDSFTGRIGRRRRRQRPWRRRQRHPPRRDVERRAVRRRRQRRKWAGESGNDAVSGGAGNDRSSRPAARAMNDNAGLGSRRRRPRRLGLPICVKLPAQRTRGGSGVRPRRTGRRRQRERGRQRPRRRRDRDRLDVR